MAEPLESAQESPHKVDYNGLGYDTTIGVFTCLALIAALWGYWWLKDFAVPGPHQRVRVRFHQVAGLTDHAGVYVAGVRVGGVEKLELQGPHRVLVVLGINARSVTIPATATFRIVSNGVVGSKQIEIQLPGNYGEGGASLPPVDESMILQGEDPLRPEVTVNRILAQLDKIDMDRLSSALRDDRQRIIEAVDQINVVATKLIPVAEKSLSLERQLEEITGTWRKSSPELNANIKQALNQANDAAKEVSSVTRQLGSVTKTVHLLASGWKDSAGDMRDGLKKALKGAGNAVGDLGSAAQEAHGLAEDLRQSTPEVTTDLRVVLAKSSTLMDHMDTTIKQLSQMLGAKHPLLKMLFGQPGQIKPAAMPFTQTKLRY